MSESVIPTEQKIYYTGGQVTVKRTSVMDVFKFAKLLAKLSSGQFVQLASKLAVFRAADKSKLSEQELVAYQQQEQAQAQQLAFAMISNLAEHDKELIDFLSGLTDLSAEEFGKLPPDVVIDVIIAIVKGEDLKRFFEKARALMSVLPNQA